MCSTTSPVIGQFIEDQLQKLNRSARSVALEIGLSPSHLSDIINGRKKPRVDVVNKIADFFQVPRSYLYELMGWIDLTTTTQTTKDDLAFLQQLAETDEAFIGLAKEYASMNPEERLQFIRVMKAWKEK